VNVSEAKQFFSKVNELDNLPPVTADEATVREAFAEIFKAGVSNAMDEFNKWTTKRDTAVAAKGPKAEDAKYYTKNKAGETILKWFPVDVKAASDEAQLLYAEFQAANKKAAELRVAFDQALIDGTPVPVGRSIEVGHRFGLAVSFPPAGSKQKVNRKARSLDSILGEIA
jgi:hypothetical protein